MSKPHILCASTCNGQEKMNKPSKLVHQSRRLRMLLKRRGSGHVRTPGGNSTSSLLNPSCIFRTNRVGAYCVNQPIRFTNGALNFLAFCSIYYYSTAHSALLKKSLGSGYDGQGTASLCSCEIGQLWLWVHEWDEGGKPVSVASLGLLAC